MVNDLVPYFPASWLKISGEDAATYLQGQMASDLRGLGPEGRYAVILDHKGKIQADAFVGKDGHGYWVCSYFVPAPELRARLEAFVVADDVTVEDATDAVAGVSLLGQGTDYLLESARRALGIQGTAFRGRRGGDECWEWILPRERQDAAVSWLIGRGAGVLEKDEVIRRRIRGGIPAVPYDAGPKDLPQETLLGEAAVSYDKGCYVGQEIMSRLKTRGRVRRQLRRIQGAGEPPAPGTAVLAGDTKVGETRSAVPDGDRFLAWAMIAGEAQALAIGTEEKRRVDYAEAR